MPDSSQYAFGATELDPGILSSAFRVQTNWHVITGAPSCGKTTLVDQLAAKGFQTTPEGARLYIETEIAKGRTIDEIRENAVALQLGIRDMQLSIEGELRAIDTVFLDRAVPDCLAWHRLFGMNPNEILLECLHHRYASVLVLDPLPYQVDSARFEDASIVGYLDEWHTRDYSALGYSIVRVPVLPPEERLVVILERLSERGLI
jgi:predicted ATPase